MEFYSEKFKSLRLKKKINMTFAAKKVGVNRSTVWSWEKNKTKPNESKTRILAEILNVSVNEISDLEPEYPLSEGKISDLTYSWRAFSGKDDFSQEAIQKVFVTKLEEMFEKYNQTTTIIKAIMTSMKFMFYVKDTSLKYITVNHQFLKDTSSQFTEDHVLNRNDYDFFSHNEARTNEKQDRHVILTGKPLVDFEGTIPGTRKKKWGLISKYPIFDSEGKIAGLTGFFVDITERKRTEEIREMLELSLSSVSDAYCIRDIEKNSYFFVSEVIEQITGVSSEKYKKGGVDFWLKNCVHPDDRDEQTQYYRNKFWPDRREYRIIRPDGSIRLIEATCEFQHLLNKEFMCSVIRDITEKRKSEEISELLRLNVDAMESALTLSSFDKKSKKDITRYSNNSTDKIFGFTAEEFYKSGIELWLNYIHPDDREREKTYLISRTWPEHDEYRVIKPDGKIVWIESTRRKKVFLGTEYTLTISKDVTEKKKKEDMKELLELCLNSISDGFIITALKGKDIYFLNQAAVEMLGYPEKKLYEGGTEFWLNHCVHPEDRPKQAKYYKDNSYPSKRKFRIIRPDGEVRTIKAKFSKKTLINKKYYLSVYKDITNNN
ncbi:MAG TPA: PAS domain-containing protein [Victivallales bacterium]|nr:PAS domain-containing protein [Victivallales bacterium]